MRWGGRAAAPDLGGTAARGRRTGRGRRRPRRPGGTFVHWLVAGLPPEQASLDDPLPPGAVEGRNDFGDVRWDGPCPPRGDDPHTYRFRVLAVAEETGLEHGFTAEDLEGAMADRLLAEGVHSGRYGR